MNHPPAHTIKNLTTDRFHLFWTDEFCQWFQAPFTAGGIGFGCCEQYMMYQKALLFGDHATAAKILACPSPAEQKKLGRAVQPFDSDVWNAAARDFVYQGNYCKFTQNPALYALMLSKGDRAFVEASPYDPIWGIGLAASDPAAQDPAQWRGKNWLGETLTRLRDDLVKARFAPAPATHRQVKPPAL